jgi:dihydroorotate dehydrogenase electron transfer subunit
MRLRTTDAPFDCRPGRFVMFDLPEDGFRFRRPFSILGTQPPDTFDLYYKIVGSGTRLMAGLEAGASVSCLGPLGTGFDEPSDPSSALYIGGGIGIAPVYFLAGRLAARGKPAGSCFYGVRSREEIGLGAELSALFGENLAMATDDGSAGFHGNVVQRLATEENRIRAARDAYVCGPTRMMEAVCALLRQINPALRIQVSLEERPEPMLPAKVCLEGPVFEADSILWRFPSPSVCGESVQAATCTGLPTVSEGSLPTCP